MEKSNIQIKFNLDTKDKMIDHIIEFKGRCVIYCIDCIFSNLVDMECKFESKRLNYEGNVKHRYEKALKLKAKRFKEIICN